MKIKEILNTRKPFPSLEIVPPQAGMTKASLLNSIAPLMAFNPPFINVTTHRDEYRYEPQPDGSFARKVVRSRVSPVAVCAAVQSRYAVEVVPHMICGGFSRWDAESQLQDFRFMGIDNVMALRGDSLVGEKRFTASPDGYAHASELVAALRAQDAEVCIGVGAYPEKHFEAPNLSTDIEHLKAKVDAGADYIITQMFFDNAKYLEFVALCRQQGIRVPILPGIKPLTTPRQLELLPEAFSIDIPRELEAQLRDCGGDREAFAKAGTDWCIRQCRELLAAGVPAIHFYTVGAPSAVLKVVSEVF
ncbi:MAG: methylenetetrahydrofolate reductase [Bacteroidales bacterium]|nr:methylenetetrahydrofolate reductase [Bacteroidales bacterium]